MKIGTRAKTILFDAPWMNLADCMHADGLHHGEDHQHAYGRIVFE